MSSFWPSLLLLVPAVPLALEDFRERRVAVVWLILLGVLAMVVGLLTHGLVTTLLCIAVNAVLLLILGGTMLAYHLIRRKPLDGFFRCSFGAGDAMMMVAVTPLFTPAGYVWFLLAGCVAALVWWSVKRPATLPLAGFMALTLAVYVLSKPAGLWN